MLFSTGVAFSDSQTRKPDNTLHDKHTPRFGQLRQRERCYVGVQHSPLLKNAPLLYDRKVGLCDSETMHRVQGFQHNPRIVALKIRPEMSFNALSVLDRT